MSHDLSTELQTKLTKANRLLNKRSFPMSLFHYYDPYLAAELYQESADICRTLDDDLQASLLYRKSFDTYLLLKDNMSKQSAAYVITKLAELHASQKHYNPAEAVKAYKDAAHYHSLTGSYSIAASKTVSAAKLAMTMHDYREGEGLFSNAMELYDKAGMPLNRALLFDDLLVCTVRNDNFRVAGDLLVEMGSSRKSEGFLVVAWIAYYLCGEERDEIYEMLGKDQELVDLVREGENEKFLEGVRGRLAKITSKEIFFEIVDVYEKRGDVIDVR